MPSFAHTQKWMCEQALEIIKKKKYTQHKWNRKTSHMHCAANWGNNTKKQHQTQIKVLRKTHRSYFLKGTNCCDYDRFANGLVCNQNEKLAKQTNQTNRILKFTAKQACTVQLALRRWDKKALNVYTKTKKSYKNTGLYGDMKVFKSNFRHQNSYADTKEIPTKETISCGEGAEKGAPKKFIWVL